MSGMNVFERLQDYYHKTEKIMQENVFQKEIATKHSQQEIVEGILMFDRYLDEQRERGVKNIDQQSCFSRSFN